MGIQWWLKPDKESEFLTVIKWFCNETESSDVIVNVVIVVVAAAAI